MPLSYHNIFLFHSVCEYDYCMSDYLRRFLMFVWTINLVVILRYYHNITSNTLVVLEAMVRHQVKTLIYSSTCATYGEPEKMPITEETPQVNAFLIFFGAFLPFSLVYVLVECHTIVNNRLCAQF